jgi:hypothetical protein
MRRSSIAVLATSALGLAVLATGCGGSSAAPSVASLGRTTPTNAGGDPSTRAGTTPKRASAAALATCFTSHGFPPVQHGSISFFGVTFNVDPSSPQFQSAIQACKKLIPGGGPPALTPAKQAEHTKDLARFAACMRKHGVPSFSDPGGNGRFPSSMLRTLDPGTPSFQTAYKACESLLPTFGMRISFG